MGEDFDLFTNIEYIAKDIQEQENKVIAMEFTKNIGYLLIENGVRVKITEYTKEIDENNSIESTFESRYGISIDGLDFTEHDKVFEDKIAELKKDYKTASELLGKYQQENEALKKRIQELDTIDAMRIKEKRELKQRISELESMEMENFSEINTSNPLACAKSLIEHMTHCEKFMIMQERDVQTFSVEELKEIADYLMVYYKHHKDRDAEDTISF